MAELTAQEAGRHRDGAPAGHGHGACPNCDTPLVGDYCHACGQMGHVHRTAGAFFHDIAHGVFHFEGRIFRTLPMLAFKPGVLTRCYIDGKRARFVSPMALFLFSVFLMFASIGLWSGRMGLDSIGRNLASVNGDLTIQRKSAEAKVTRLQQERAEAVRDREPAVEIADYDRRIAKARTQAGDIARAQAALGATTGLADESGEDFTVHSKIPLIDARVKHALENPQLTLYKLKTAAYKYSWALIPISLPFIWLMFPFSRRFGFYDHAIFATYSLSFMTLLVVAGSVAFWAGAPSGMVWLALALIPPVHMYAQLKGTYRLGRWGAGIRTVVLLHLTVFATALFAVLLAYLGLA